MAFGGANGLAADIDDTIARTLNLPLLRLITVFDILSGLAFTLGLLSPGGYIPALPLLGQKIEGFIIQAPGEHLLRVNQYSLTLTKSLKDKGDTGDSSYRLLN